MNNDLQEDILKIAKYDEWLELPRYSKMSDTSEFLPLTQQTTYDKFMNEIRNLHILGIIEYKMEPSYDEANKRTEMIQVVRRQTPIEIHNHDSNQKGWELR